MTSAAQMYRLMVRLSAAWWRRRRHRPLYSQRRAAAIAQNRTSRHGEGVGANDGVLARS